MKQIYIDTNDTSVNIPGVGTFNAGWVDFSAKDEAKFKEEYGVSVDTQYRTRTTSKVKTTTKSKTTTTKGGKS